MTKWSLYGEGIHSTDSDFLSSNTRSRIPICFSFHLSTILNILLFIYFPIYLFFLLFNYVTTICCIFLKCIHQESTFPDPWGSYDPPPVQISIDLSLQRSPAIYFLGEILFVKFSVFRFFRFSVFRFFRFSVFRFFSFLVFQFFSFSVSILHFVHYFLLFFLSIFLFVYLLIFLLLYSSMFYRCIIFYVTKLFLFILFLVYLYVSW